MGGDGPGGDAGHAVGVCVAVGAEGGGVEGGEEVCVDVYAGWEVCGGVWVWWGRGGHCEGDGLICLCGVGCWREKRDVGSSRTSRGVGGWWIARDKDAPVG